MLAQRQHDNQYTFAKVAWLPRAGEWAFDAFMPGG